jgi:hypothetical protein
VWHRGAAATIDTRAPNAQREGTSHHAHGLPLSMSSPFSEACSRLVAKQQQNSPKERLSSDELSWALSSRSATPLMVHEFEKEKKSGLVSLINRTVGSDFQIPALPGVSTFCDIEHLESSRHNGLPIQSKVLVHLPAISIFVSISLLQVDHRLREFSNCLFSLGRAPIR